MTTINDVASLAQVSTATVSHVINKTRKVNQETIDKVEWAIRELNYQPNEQARSLKTGQSRLIGVMNYYSVDAYFSEVLSSLEASAHTAGYNVLLRHTERYGENQAEAINAWRNKNIDGLVINSPYVTDDFYEQIEKLGCPYVILHIKDPACKGDIIRVKDLEASEEATRVSPASPVAPSNIKRPLNAALDMKKLCKMPAFPSMKNISFVRNTAFRKVTTHLVP
jgi:LacI family transcriptional regulator